MWRLIGVCASKPPIAFVRRADNKPTDKETRLARPLSIEEAYQWVQRFVAREWRLLLPVVLAFMALPGLILALPPLQASAGRLAAAMQTHDMAGISASAGWVVLPGLFVFLVATLGGLAVTALALLPGISVREAIGLAARRLGILIGSLLLLLLAEMALTILLALLLGLARVNPLAIESVIVLVLLALGLVLGVRLLLLGPMIVRRRIGPLSALRETWVLTQGHFWRIFAAAAIYMIGAMVVMLALSAGIGSLLVLAGNALGAAELGQMMDALFQQIVGAVVALGFHLLAAAIFRQLDGSSRGI